MTVVDPVIERNAAAATAPHWRTFRPDIWLPAVVFGVVLLLLWQAVCSIGGIPSYLLPSPTAIASSVAENSSIIVRASSVTAQNAAGGLIIGIVLGILAAMASVWARPVDEILSPVASAAAAIPIVAIAPILYGMYSATQEMPRMLTVAVIVFFPVYVSCARGLRNVSAVHADLMHSYAVSKWAVTRTVRIPGAVGFLFTGLRVAAPNAVIAEIVAEYFGGVQNGIGCRITSAAAATNYAQAWAYVFAAVVVGLTFFLVVLAVEVVATRTLVAPYTRAD